MKELIKRLSKLNSSQKTNLLLVGSLVLILILAVLGYNRLFVKHTAGPVQEVDLPFDPTGPYALLLPRDDGNALVLDITRVGEYDAISYDLEYQSNGIDRGVHGDVKKLDQGGKKSEYSQEILFGTCSQGFTRAGPHCVFDPNVENGTLTLHIQKGDIDYRMITTWHLQKPDVSLGLITSGDDHFHYTSTAGRSDLALVGYTIVNDLSGVPKLPGGKTVLGKVYALNVPQARSLSGSAALEIDLADAPPAGTQIARYNDAANNWELLQTKPATSSSQLTASVSGGGIFAVLAPQASK